MFKRMGKTNKPTDKMSKPMSQPAGGSGKRGMGEMRKQTGRTGKPGPVYMYNYM